ncbi:hypothetical protein [Chryseobacterium koreense]|uniref:Uncharacterized protein n=1 Tax=Chryseobacterium koreense CCUG 49689 TaxID=1304281 RepID=A0A0J7J1Q9_9FLAO|nr:hypothetical protein [Chryseobacterium koreense]KMQ72348.1 hypothetical protein ACM44_02605 [Chryseobacterium koreense CCUG 49689]MBB5333950.1 hypothetical protein [Chryseobacterium koreense]
MGNKISEIKIYVFIFFFFAELGYAQEINGFWVNENLRNKILSNQLGDSVKSGDLPFFIKIENQKRFKFNQIEPFGEIKYDSIYRKKKNQYSLKKEKYILKNDSSIMIYNDGHKNIIFRKEKTERGDDLFNVNSYLITTYVEPKKIISFIDKQNTEIPIKCYANKNEVECASEDLNFSYTIRFNWLYHFKGKWDQKEYSFLLFLNNNSSNFEFIKKGNSYSIKKL